MSNETDDVYKGPIPSAAAASSPRPSEELPKGIRTYATDVAEALEDKKTSVADMVLAEKRRNPGKKEGEPKKRSKLPYLLAAGVAVLLAGGLGVWLLSQDLSSGNETGTENTKLPDAASFIVTDSEAELRIDAASDGTRRTLLLARIAEERSAPLTLGFIKHLYVTKASAGAASDTPPLRLASSADFFNALELGPPPQLFRSLRSEFMFGLHGTGASEPFLILKTDFYEGAFSGMLDWEETAVADLEGLITTARASSQAASTSEASVPEPSPAFKDEVIQNRDARVLRDAAGKSVMLYSFPDRETIIIATNEATLTELFDRLSAARFER
jgi:hypothetical protein